ncbi:hypothetical protein BGX21_006356 [Mortierella sp. AD011]|nr:hypothetical protein BGX20_006470 [Mortierella sp. AD010]KAF9399367.1 hypothetical protein BGX21_006356 [Mortierella sp. AD011]
MQSHRRDESTAINLANLGQSRSRSQPQRQRNASSPLSPESSNIFNHLSTLDSPVGSSGRPPVYSSKGSKHGEKKDCPRHADGHPPNKLEKKELGDKRVLYLFYGSDVTLFENIMAYKLGNPDRHVDDAIDTFSEHQGADALANIIYGTQAFDMVFKYTIPDHLRKIPDEPPVLGLGPTLSDINLDGNSNNDTKTRVDEKQELKQRQDKADEQQRQTEHLLAAAPEKDVEAAVKDPKVERDEKTQRHRLRFLKALLKEGLVIEEEPNIEGEEMYVRIYTPFWRLCVEAQRLRMKMELTHFQTRDEKAAADKEKNQNWLSRYVFRILQRADHVSLPLRTESLLFKANKLRQYALAEKSRKWSDIVRHGGGITADGSGVGSQIGSDGKDGFFGTAQRGRLTESIIVYSKIHTKFGDRLALKAVMDRKAFTYFFTLHDGSFKSKVLPIPNRRTLLFDGWVKSRHPQPLEEIRFYYGEKIALYFAWIGYYTKWLIPAAILGFLFFIGGVINYVTHESTGNPLTDSKRTVQLLFDNPGTLPFALFMAIWSSLFVEFWKRRSNVLAYRWNTLDFERHERSRPHFKPTSTRISPVTGKKELYFPRYRQIISILISVMVVLISIAIVVVSVGSLLFFNVWLRKSNENVIMSVARKNEITVLTAILNLVVILILGNVYARLARFLTDNENHRRGTQHEDALIIKRFLFDFVNFYSALFYIAYFKESVGGTLFKADGYVDTCAYESCIVELTIQLAIVFVGKQFLNQFQELAVPKLHEIWNRKSELAVKASLKRSYQDKKSMKKPPQWAKDDILPDCDPTMFEEYRELVIQFGFCTLFVTAFPVAPIFALLNNILEIRVDAYKLLTQHRRPIAQPAQDIGSWCTILELLTHISVFTNACLIAFQSSWMETNVFRNVHWVHDDVPGQFNYALLAVRLLFIFIFEHLVFFWKIVIRHLVRDVPRTVKLAIERENYYTRLALEDEEPAVDEVLEDFDDDSDESDDDDDFRKKLMSLAGVGASDDSLDDNGAGDGEGIEAAEEQEDEEELEALIKAGGCGCAAHGDGTLGTVNGGFDATWMSRIRPDMTQAALKRRRQRSRKKQTAQ